MLHVNGMGGLVCTACSPPRSDLDVQMRLMVIVIGATFDGESPEAEQAIPWACWGERAFAAVDEGQRSRITQVANAMSTASTTSAVTAQRKLTGGKIVWADADEEGVNQRLAAAKGESLDEFRRSKMESF
jgi:hypothetical protein